MSSVTRRRALAMTAGSIGALAGCTMSSPEDCSPASFPEDGEREEPPSPCQFSAELQTQGLDVDSAMDAAGGGVSVMYYHNPDAHRDQIRTVALAFIQYRRMVSKDNMLSFTALESNDDRHGTGYANREWADRRASGELSRDKYVQKVVDSYGSR